MNSKFFSFALVTVALVFGGCVNSPYGAFKDGDGGNAGTGGSGNSPPVNVCDKDADEYISHTCTDGAGHHGDDCDDGNANVHPDATELCNGIDDDCDGSVDEGLSSCNPPADSDHDGDPNSTDCDDDNAYVHHGAPEECNGIDDNCVGGIDEGCNTGTGGSGNASPGTCPNDPSKSIDCVSCADTVEYKVTVHADLADSLVLEGGTVEYGAMESDTDYAETYGSGFNWVAVQPAVASTDAVFTFRGCAEKSFRFQVTGEHIPNNGPNQVAFTCTKPEYQIPGLSPQITVRRDGVTISYIDTIVNWYPDKNGRNCQMDD